MFTRQERVKREGSEYFTWEPAPAATATAAIETGTQFPRARKYQPLDFIEVCNNDVVDLTLTINGNITLPVPAGVIRKVVNQTLWQVGITNDDAATNATAGAIVVSMRREPMTIDDYARGKR